MEKFKSIHQAIFTAYKLTNRNEDEKRKMRKLINRHFNKKYKDKKWDELSSSEQKYFVYITIKSAIFEHYIEKNMRSQIEKKINKEIDALFLETNAKIEEHNNKTLNYFKKYYNKNSSDNDKKQAYKEFCKDFTAINNKFPLPTYDEWIKQNNQNSLRIYDYLQELDAELSAQNNSLVPQYEINNIIIKTILKILSENFQIQVDVPLIEECLTFEHNYHNEDEYSPLLATFDPSLELNEDEQNEIIEMNKKHCYYKEKLDTLNFYYKK